MAATLKSLTEQFDDMADDLGVQITATESVLHQFAADDREVVEAALAKQRDARDLLVQAANLVAKAEKAARQ